MSKEAAALTLTMAVSWGIYEIAPYLIDTPSEPLGRALLRRW